MPGFAMLRAIGLALVTGTACHAQSLQSVSGVVLVDTGQGFRAVSPDFVLSPGTRVMVTPQGSAEIVLADGCVQPVRPGAVLTVETVEQCAARSVAEARTAEQISTQATTAGGDAAAATTVPASPPPAPPGLLANPLPYVVGVGVIVGGVALGSTLANSDRPASAQ